MKNNKDVRIKEQLNDRIKKGDFIILGKILGCEQNTARMRFNRDVENAVNVMNDIVENRENFITNYALRQDSVIVDCAIIEDLKFLVVIQYKGDLHYNLYDTGVLMNLRVADFISEVLKDVPASIKLIVTDCSIGFLPKVVDAIKNFGFKQVFKHSTSSKVEALVQKLTSNN